MHADRFPFSPAGRGRDAERADRRRPLRNADLRSGDERVRRSRGGAAVVRRRRPRDARLRARRGGQGPAGRRDFLYLAARHPRIAGRALGLHRTPLRHQMPGRPADGHDRRHAGDPAVVPASARSRRQYRDRLADLAEHHLGHPAGPRRAQIRGARPQAGRQLEARPAEGIRRGGRSYARDLRQLAGQSDGLDDEHGRAARACSISPRSAASGSWPTRSMPG